MRRVIPWRGAVRGARIMALDANLDANVSSIDDPID